MLSGQDDKKPFFKKDFRGEVRQINRRAQKANIDLQFPKRFILPRGQHVLALDFSSRETFQVFGDCLIHFFAKPRSNSDLHQTGLAPLSESSSIDGMLCLGEQFSRFVQKDPARMGQFDVAFIPHEELNPSFVFQLMNLMAQRRLRHVQPPRGSAEVQFFSNGDKIAKMAKFHRRILISAAY